MAKIKVDFLGPIELPSLELEIQTLEELKTELQKINSLQEWLPLSAVAINDEIIDSLEFIFKDGDRVVLLPPVCGGEVRE